MSGDALVINTNQDIITEFNKLNSQIIVTKLREDLKKLAIKYGINDIDIGPSTYTGGELTAKLTMKVHKITEDGETADTGQVDWINYHTKFGLPKDGYGKVITLQNGKQCKLIGIQKNARTYPVLGVCDNKTYKYKSEMVIQLLKVQYGI